MLGERLRAPGSPGHARHTASLRRDAAQGRHSCADGRRIPPGSRRAGGLATGALVPPVAFHRFSAGHGLKAELVHVAGRLIAVGLVALALTITAALLLLLRTATGGPKAAWVRSAGVGLWFATTWLVLPWSCCAGRPGAAGRPRRPPAVRPAAADRRPACAAGPVPTGRPEHRNGPAPVVRKRPVPGHTTDHEVCVTSRKRTAGVSHGPSFRDRPSGGPGEPPASTRGSGIVGRAVRRHAVRRHAAGRLGPEPARPRLARPVAHPTDSLPDSRGFP
ncbi:DUF6328 family protein [Kitasatospora sp. NBC_00240]|uniref:DUF6328 family protein n=1 Tax=Kitasatospora sp. NBC_00240 TaxID=2903567 RepID=UPI002253FD3A|nr:DUF6328 family protein [Kitasatospora sp. NBC_00240]MCX5215272.1 DUF6328 family protein [Kitasatospora sp. NBC_00240]